MVAEVRIVEHAQVQRSDQRAGASLHLHTTYISAEILGGLSQLAARQVGSDKLGCRLLRVWTALRGVERSPPTARAPSCRYGTRSTRLRTASTRKGLRSTKSARGDARVRHRRADADAHAVERRVGAHAIEHLPAVEDRHHQIEQHQPRWPLFDLGHRLGAVGRDGDGEAFVLERGAQRFANLAIIVDDQQPKRIHRTLPSRHTAPPLYRNRGRRRNEDSAVKRSSTGTVGRISLRATSLLRAGNNRRIGFTCRRNRWRLRESTPATRRGS